MKRLITLWCVLLLPIWAQGVYAQVDISFSGTTGNASGHYGDVFAVGGIAFCQMCGPITPGTSVSPNLSLEYDTASGGGIECGPENMCMLSTDDIQTLPGRHITFPTNGQDIFTVRVPDVSESGVSGSLVLPDGSTSPISFGGSEGVLVLDFAFISFGTPAPFYLLEGGTFTSPVAEPGPLGLMAAGLAGLLGVVLKRRKLPRGVPMNPQARRFGADPAMLLSAG